MKNYSVTKLPTARAFVFEGDFIPGSIPVNIPDSDRRKHNFISLYVRITDLDHALAMLSFISPNNPYTVNRALFIATLAELFKCFDGTDKYSILDYNNFAKFSPDASVEFKRYKDLRNKHYMHVANEMTEGFAFLLVAPEDSGALFGGVPSVIVDSQEIDYLDERDCLAWVLREAKKYAVQEFDKIADSLTRDYSDKTREELLSYGHVVPTPARLP